MLAKVEGLNIRVICEFGDPTVYPFANKDALNYMKNDNPKLAKAGVLKPLRPMIDAYKKNKQPLTIAMLREFD